MPEAPITICEVDLWMFQLYSLGQRLSMRVFLFYCGIGSSFSILYTWQGLNITSSRRQNHNCSSGIIHSNELLVYHIPVKQHPSKGAVYIDA